MRRFLICFFVIMSAVVLTAQEKDLLQFAVTTKMLSAEILDQFDLSEEDVEDILLSQSELQVFNGETRVELDLVKAKLTRVLYYPDPDLGEVDDLLEQAGELRLEQEKQQVRTYVQIREILGEDNWSEFIQTFRRPARPNAKRPAEPLRDNSRLAQPGQRDSIGR